MADDSVRSNILFGEKYDEERYLQTLHACALESDLDGFPEGDQTRVGEKGLSMSGSVLASIELQGSTYLITPHYDHRRGQKQRISLARAVYARSEIVILDDVLSAVDR